MLCRREYCHASPGQFNGILAKTKTQGIVGYFLFALNTAKRCVEVLHCLGLSISYETVISALWQDGEALLKQLREEIRH